MFSILILFCSQFCSYFLCYFMFFFSILNSLDSWAPCWAPKLTLFGAQRASWDFSLEPLSGNYIGAKQPIVGSKDDFQPLSLKSENPWNISNSTQKSYWKKKTTSIHGKLKSEKVMTCLHHMAHRVWHMTWYTVVILNYILQSVLDKSNLFCKSITQY